MRSLEARQWINGVTFLGASDTLLVLIAAVATKNLVITYCNYTPLTSAAQTVTIEGTDGTDILRIPASPIVPYPLGPLFVGIALTPGAGLQIVTPVAGNAGTVVYEGYYNS